MTDRRSVLLITSNGTGMGHLVRQLAIAASMPADVRCTILTLSKAASTAAREGAPIEYCPSYATPWITKRAWHRGYLRDRIVALAEEVDADVIAFDGVVPYPGLLAAMRRLAAASVWVRRGVWRADASTAPLAYADLFDLIIEPADVGAPMDAGATKGRGDARRVGVITRAREQGMLDRDAAARVLGVDPERPTVLFNVGSSSVPGLDAVMRHLATRDDVQVVSTRDALDRAAAESPEGRVRTVAGLFPLHPYLSAIDLAVTSAGYNAAHEFTACAVPTVLVPAESVTDDQRARALAMQQRGLGVVAESAASIATIVERLVDDELARAAMALAAREVAETWTDGASEAAALLAGLTPRGKFDLFPLVRLRIRLAAEALLAVRDHRPSIPGAVLTQDLRTVDLGGAEAVEHVLAGTSQDYLDRRGVIARHWLGVEPRTL